MRISVLTPSFGYAQFIEDAIASVRAQSFDHEIEHVIVDGGSEDGTVQILKRHEVDWISEPDKGQSDALNKALRRASGEWLMWLNADEFYLPGAMTRLAPVLSRTHNDVVFGDAIFTDVSGDFLRLLPAHRFMSEALTWYGCFISSCAVALRRSSVESVGGWDLRMRTAMDWGLYLRLMRQGARFGYLPAPIGAFRVHEQQVTAAPLSAFPDDMRILQEELGVWPFRGSRQLGRLLHATLKLADKGYRHQRQARRRLTGHSLRWFSSQESEQISGFLGEAYVE